MLALTFTCRVLLIHLLTDSVKMANKNQLLVLEQPWRQACVLDCARERHRAVCGSNGRMYKSLCSFQRAQCINRQLRKATMSTCTDALRFNCHLARSQALRASARSESFAIFIPECNADGTYTEVQCHNQTGYCWCSRPDGIPVSGSSVLHLRPNCTGQVSDVAEETDQESAPQKRGIQWRSTPDPEQRSVLTAHEITVPPLWLTIQMNADPYGNRSVGRRADSLKTCEHERMTLLSETANQGSEERFIPECSADGRYKAVQCHSSTGFCWCVRVDSGRPVPGTSDRLTPPSFIREEMLSMREGKNQTPDCGSQETHVTFINSSYTRTPLAGCPGVRQADFLKRLMDDFQQEVENTALSSPHSTPDGPPHVSSSSPRTLGRFFLQLDADGDAFLSEREWRPLRLLLRRSLRPHRCAKKFIQSCDRNADRGLNAHEFTSCFGI